MQFVVAGVLGLLIIAVVRIARRRRRRAIFSRRDGMEQTVTTIIVAPLIASAVALIVSFVLYRDIKTAVIYASLTAGFSYLGAVVLGIPVYCIRRLQNPASPDITWAAGALIASQPDLSSGESR
ncbi:MAG TPA: hypothetical protein VFW28_08320 [Micropepsaceae bacterium]|nr:hypothetical protein [Micropepsaceae bacterium]